MTKFIRNKFDIFWASYFHKYLNMIYFLHVTTHHTALMCTTLPSEFWFRSLISARASPLNHPSNEWKLYAIFHLLPPLFIIKKRSEYFKNLIMLAIRRREMVPMREMKERKKAANLQGPHNLANCHTRWLPATWSPASWFFPSFWACWHICLMASHSSWP